MTSFSGFRNKGMSSQEVLQISVTKKNPVKTEKKGAPLIYSLSDLTKKNTKKRVF